MEPRQVKTAADARKIVKQRGLTHVKVGLSDIDGIMRGKYMARDKFLSALEKECTKATFFIVGQMAKAYPETLRKTAAAGHTIAYHTMTHPLNMVKWPLAKAQENIQTGWQVVDQILYGQSGEKPAMSTSTRLPLCLVMRCFAVPSTRAISRRPSSR